MSDDVRRETPRGASLSGELVELRATTRTIANSAATKNALSARSTTVRMRAARAPLSNLLILALNRLGSVRVNVRLFASYREAAGVVTYS